MAKFQYKAKNMAGAVIEGIYDAPNRQAVTDMIRQQAYFVLDIKQVTDTKSMNIELFSKIPVKDISIFCRQFAVILRAGIPLVQAMQMLTVQTENKQLSEIIRQMTTEIQKGSSLSQAMKMHEKRFPAILIHMIEAGELSGTMDLSLDRMAKHFEKNYKLQKKVKGAMTYPIIVCIVAVIVVIFLMAFVVPTFVQMFEGGGVELPGITKALIAISNFVRYRGYIALIIIVAAFVGFRIYLNTEDGRYNFDKFKFSMPILGNIQYKSVAANFASTMSTLMATGVGITEAIDITSKVLQNAFAKDCLDDVKRQVMEGKGLYQPLKQTKLFPPMLENMVMLGEESGTLEGMLSNSAEFFEDEVETATAKLTTMLEPLIILFLGGAVAFIVVAIALPMFNMTSLVKV